MKKIYRNQKGFSLLELILVLAVIAIIMYFLLPALKNLREKGRQGICINNLKELHRGFMLYAADYNGWLPASVWWDSSSASTPIDNDGDGNPDDTDGDGAPNFTYAIGNVWDFMIGPYVYKEHQGGTTISAARTLRCPTYVLQNRDLDSSSQPIERTYGMPEGWAGGVDTQSNPEDWPHMDKVVDPMNTVLLGEVLRATDPSLGISIESAVVFNNLNTNLNAQCHGAGANYLFVDGHVKFMTPNQAKDTSTYNLWDNS